MPKPTQSEKFKAAAKEVEADQDEAAFKKRLEKMRSQLKVQRANDT
jgi:hypothetical protein